MWYLSAFFVGVGVTLAVISILVTAAVQQPPPRRPPLPRPSPPVTPPGKVVAAEVTRTRLIYQDEQPD